MSTAAANTIPATIRTSPLISLRSRPAAGSPRSGCSRAATSPGFERSRLPEAIAITTSSSPVLTRIATPKPVSHRAFTAGMCSIVSPIPVAAITITETSATFENRGTIVASPSTRRPRPSPTQISSSPIRPPNHTDPAARCSQSNTSVRPRGEVWAACPAAPGTISTAAAASTAPAIAPNAATERCSRSGSSSHTAIQPATQNSAKHSSRSRIARPKAVTPNSGTSAPTSNTERSESFAVEISRYTGIAISPTTDAATNATDTFRRLAPRTRRTSGRAISVRSTNSPIALITDTNITHRAISRFALIAVAETLGTLNCGAGPGSGPTA